MLAESGRRFPCVYSFDLSRCDLPALALAQVLKGKEPLVSSVFFMLLRDKARGSPQPAAVSVVYVVALPMSTYDMFSWHICATSLPCSLCPSQLLTEVSGPSHGDT